MSPSLHICTHMHALVFSKKIADGVFSWSYIISRWRSWIKPDGNKSVKLETWKNKNGGVWSWVKKTIILLPRSFPEPFKKTNLSITRLKKQRNSVPHRNTWTVTLCLKCFTAVKTSVNKNNLWGKNPQSSKLCPWFQPKTELRGKAIIFRLTEHAVKIYSRVH